MIKCETYPKFTSEYKFFVMLRGKGLNACFYKIHLHLVLLKLHTAANISFDLYINIYVQQFFAKVTIIRKLYAQLVII